MAEAQRKDNTVPFPKKDVPTVNMFSPLIEKVAVPAAWFIGGIVFAKLFLGKKEHTVIHKSPLGL
jgi:hypothetical protein